jgi:hypothetical protein
MDLCALYCKVKTGIGIFINNSGAWIIYGSRLLQRQGSGPRSCRELPQVGCNEAANPPHPAIWLARRVKAADGILR